MATDEAILMAVAEEKLPSTLRFFAWEPPCLSIGYNDKSCSAAVRSIADELRSTSASVVAQGQTRMRIAG